MTAVTRNMTDLKDEILSKIDDDDDDDDDDVFVVWLTDERCLALFPAGTIVRDPHHRQSLTRCGQGLNMCRT